MAQLVFLIEVKACEFLLLTDWERFSYRSVSTGWQGNPFLENSLYATLRKKLQEIKERG